MIFIQRKIRFMALLLVCLIMSSNVYAQERITQGIAVIHPIKNNTVHGIVTFTAVIGGVRVVADLSGLTPGEHGFHIHEFGDCSAPDGSSTGGHFNPTKKMHGCLLSSEHHVGDLGNITADKDGHAHYDSMNKDIKLEGVDNIIGRAIIIHEGGDDCKTQPTGNSGARIGCGIIGIRK